MGITSSAWCLAYSRCSINGGQGIEPRSPALGYTKGVRSNWKFPHRLQRLPGAHPPPLLEAEEEGSSQEGAKGCR